MRHLLAHPMSSTGIGTVLAARFGLDLNPWRLVVGTEKADSIVPTGPLRSALLRDGDDVFSSMFEVRHLDAGRGNDSVWLRDTGGSVSLGHGDDTLDAQGHVRSVRAGSGDDDVTLGDGADYVSLGRGDDTLDAQGWVSRVMAGSGDDRVTLADGAGSVFLGSGDDTLEVGRLAGRAFGGWGEDTIVFDFDLGGADILAQNGKVTFIDRFSGETLDARQFETFVFADIERDAGEIAAAYAPGAAPVIHVGGGTQTVTVNDASPTVSVVWDRTVQQAVIEHEGYNGPTIASRAYAMVHTAMYDAWASYDDVAVRVSFDAEGDNGLLAAGAVSTDDNKTKAMSYAAYTVLNHLYPEQGSLFDTVMGTRFSFALEDDGSIEAAIGIDAAEDLIALRFTDGANQADDYAGSFIPTNPSPLEINDITAWTPENVPLDPEDANPEQSHLTPQWEDVESFALPESADGAVTNFDPVRPPDPQDFFVEAQSGATLDFDAAEITLGAEVTLDGVTYAAGDVIAVSKDLIGPVINPGFIDQAQEVVDYSANLTDRDKIIAEFWEDAGGTAFPPGTFMTFAQYVSARDDHDIDTDAAMFLAMGNAVMDAGIATWHVKVDTDYVRPVRAIRDLGELGLIGEPGVDELTGETGYVIEAWGGVDPVTGEGLGTRTVLAENFVTFQRPFLDASPPFGEFTSGHSGFSAAGAEVLRLFTGSDEFGGSVTFAPGSTQFEVGVPAVETTLAWETFSDAADEAGLSRLYGNIHFHEGDIYGRQLGRDAGELAYETAQAFVDGTAADADRPFWTDDFSAIA